MAEVKSKDFVEIEYVGMIKDTGSVFDTNIEKVAKESAIGSKGHEFHPMVICVGENHMLKGLEEQIVGKQVGKEYTFEVSHDKAFGKKDTKLIQLIPTSKFLKQKIQPAVGLQLNIDGVFGIIKTVSGGRCYVDFNHPLAGKDLTYKVKINKIVTDDKEKLNALLHTHFHMHNPKIEITEGKAVVQADAKIPKEAQVEFSKMVSLSVPSIKEVTINEERKNK